MEMAGLVPAFSFYEARFALARFVHANRCALRAQTLQESAAKDTVCSTNDT
jgi:hypothetical protein